MKFQMRVENIANRTVSLDWLESRYDLKAGEKTLVELKHTLLFHKGQKADKAMKKLQSQLDKGLVRIIVVTDQLTQNIVSENDTLPARTGRRNTGKSRTVSYEQQLVNQKMEQAVDTQDPAGRFTAVKADDYESAERLSPTPGTGRAQDEKVLDMTGKSMHETHQDQQNRELRDSVVQQSQAQQDAQSKQASESGSKEPGSGSTTAGTAKTSPSAKAKSTSSQKTSQKTSQKSTKSIGTKSSTTKSTTSKTTGSTGTKSTKSVGSAESEDNVSGGE